MTEVAPRGAQGAAAGGQGGGGQGGGGGGGTVVRRIILLTILFSLVTVAAIGLAGLVERIIGPAQVIVEDQASLARALAFTLIGVPLAAVLTWWQHRRLADAAERASLVWTLYLTAMSLTSLIIATVTAAATMNAAIEGEWAPRDAATALVWTGVWVWHRRLRRGRATAPTRLADLPVELGALWGLAVGAVGAVAALAMLVSRALAVAAVVLVDTLSWGQAVLQSLVWCLLGATVWWWHWFRERAARAPGAFAAVLLVIVIGAAAAATLVALANTLHVLLRVLVAGPDPDVLSTLDTSLATALVAAVVWTYHAQVLATRPEPSRRAGRLVISAIALIQAASGFGVVINALLAGLVTTLVDAEPQNLLLGGISALVVGGPTWWLAWRPDRTRAADAADPARRVYLVVIFGASAIAAVATLLLIGYQVFEFALGGGAAGGLIEQIRAPLGVLGATALVFGYHFAVWRHDRAASPRTVRRRIGRVIVVAAGDVASHSAAVRAATGAPVSVWPAADDTARLSDDPAPLLAALESVTAPRVLVIAEAGGGFRVVGLAD